MTFDLSHTQRLNDEIERLRTEVAALKEAAEPRILSMQVRDGGLDMELYGTACRALAESFAEEFQKGGGVNYLECRFTSRTVMPDESFVVTVQRTEGKTPHQLRQEAESALAALRKRMAESRPLFARYDKRMESPAAGFTGTIAIRVEDYDALRSLVVEG